MLEFRTTGVDWEVAGSGRGGVIGGEHMQARVDRKGHGAPLNARKLPMAERVEFESGSYRQCSKGGFS